MKSSTRLDSVVFQLTPTRTRYDLVISAEGKKEKIASGLLTPFLSHLKTAQDQIHRGAYSILLQPDSAQDATWFTKGTLASFVRFVSTPEILERVYTIESEILQLEEAISLQTNNDTGLSAVEDQMIKPVEPIEGSRSLQESVEEKAIVIYKPVAHPIEANRSGVEEVNSKVQLMKVLETRRLALQKEQGMAFARAVAAGFDIDDMSPLLSFGQRFGASRLMDACVKFTNLWKKKHETGQWLEMEASEALFMRPDMSPLNESGILFTSAGTAQKELEVAASRNGGQIGSETSGDGTTSMDNNRTGYQERQGQFSQNMFPSWPIHSPSGTFPLFQGYPMPYYTKHPGSSHFSQSPYPSVEDPRLSAGQKIRVRRHSMDSKDIAENWDAEKARSEEDKELEKETLESRKQRKKSERSGRKQSNMVVIRNLNYITSEKQNSSGTSVTESDDEDQNNKNSVRSNGKGTNHTKTVVDKEIAADCTGPDGGNWQAFQNYLLRESEEEECKIDQDMFGMDKEVRVKRRKNPAGCDPLINEKRDRGQYQEANMIDMPSMNENMTRRVRASNDESLVSRRMGSSGGDRISIANQMNIYSTELDDKRTVHRSFENDEFIDKYYANSSDPLAVNGFERARNNLENRSSHNMNDDSYIVSLRTRSGDEMWRTDQNGIDIDSEILASEHKAESISNKIGNQQNYEPDDLTLIPERGTERRLLGFDPALDYDSQARVGGSASLNKKKTAVIDKQGTKKSETDQKSRLGSDRKKVGAIRKGRPSKLSPLDEAKARAEKLRNFKVDLQKMKKEKEEEEMKRIEALRLARQKRIAAKSNPAAARSPLPTQETKKQLPTKYLPSSHRGSKFSDSVPGLSSPLQRVPIRAVSLPLTDPPKHSKQIKLTTGSQSAGNKTSRSVSSLPVPKKESIVTVDAKASMSRIRRLSEPKMSNVTRISSVKARSTKPSAKVSIGPEIKKISAIVNHDKSMTASLPELRIRTFKGPDTTPAKSVVDDKVRKHNNNESSTSEVELNRNKDKSRQSDGDDTTIIEKEVVMLEGEKPFVPVVRTSVKGVSLETGQIDSHKSDERVGELTEYATQPPAKLVGVDGLDRKQIEYQSQMQPLTNGTELVRKEKLIYTQTDSTAFTIGTIAENTCQALYAPVSSLEDSCTEHAEFCRAPPAGDHINNVEPKNGKAFVSDCKSLKLEKIPEKFDKPHTKEVSRGIKRLLKFGRKTHGSSAGECSVDSDSTSVDDSKPDALVSKAVTLSGVNTLKNLISQDETPVTGATQQKPSRNFSLLSPFRSKNSEKKPPT